MPDEPAVLDQTPVAQVPVAAKDETALPQADSTPEPQKEPEAEPNPVDLAASARVKQELTKTAQAMGLEGEFSTSDELNAAILSRQEETREQEAETSFQSVVEDVYVDIFDALSGIEFDYKDADGTESKYSLSADQIKEAVGKPMVTKLMTGMRALAEKDAFEGLGALAAEILPEDQWDAFEALAKGKDGKGISVKEWQRHLIDLAAPHTTSVQAAIAKAKADGWTEAQNAPAGMVTQQRTAGGAGKLTAKEFLDATPEQRADMWRTKPEEVRALS